MVAMRASALSGDSMPLAVSSAPAPFYIFGLFSPTLRSDAEPVFESFFSNRSGGHCWRFDYGIRKTVKDQLPFGKSARIPRPRTRWILPVITAVFATMAESSVAAISVEGTPTPAEAQLLDLAKERFGNDIWPSEGILFRAAANGEEADCSRGSLEDRKIRANRLEWLCTDRKASGLLTYRGISVSGAIIEGTMNLE